MPVSMMQNLNYGFSADTRKTHPLPASVSLLVIEGLIFVDDPRKHFVDDPRKLFVGDPRKLDDFTRIMLQYSHIPDRLHFAALPML